MEVLSVRDLWGVGIGLSLALSAAQSTGQGSDPARLSLRFEGQAGCPTAQEIRGNIDRLLGRPADQLLSEPLQVTATVNELSPNRFSLDLRIEPESRGGERQLIGSSCEELARASAVIVALAIDPELRVEDEPAEVTPAQPAVVAGGITSSTAEPPASAPPPKEVGAVAPPPAARRAATGEQDVLSWRLRTLGALTIGELPEPAPGALVGGGVSLDSMVLWLNGGFLGWQKKELDRYGGEFLLLGGGLSVCWEVRRGRFWAGPCAGVELRWLQASGLGIANARTEGRLLMELAGGAEVGFQFWRDWAAFVSGQLLVPQQRPSFVVDELGAVHSIPAYGGRVGAGIQLQL